MPPKAGKRPSAGGGGAGKKAKKGTSDLPAISPDNLRLPHMALFDQWLFFGEIMELGCPKKQPPKYEQLCFLIFS
jgi:hypothetical protein